MHFFVRREMERWSGLVLMLLFENMPRNRMFCSIIWFSETQAMELLG